MANILLVDDDAMVLATVRKMLERGGHAVTVGRDGREAIRVCEQAVPDLLLIDIIMPDKEGVETIIDVRKRWPDLPIVAMSGGGRRDASDFLHVARKLGADATIEKPFTGEALTAVIGKLLS